MLQGSFKLYADSGFDASNFIGLCLKGYFEIILKDLVFNNTLK